MCGIVGFYGAAQSVDPKAMEKACDLLQHRGPDHHDVWQHQTVSLGHTRLSIIDLEGGDQPLTADDGNLVLVANGEIYNYVELTVELKQKGHVFKTQSDCEVILHAYREYGDSFITRINGMFSFALFDCRAERLILARDRLGIKPLFVAQTPAGVAFASELKALGPLMSQWEIDPLGLYQYFQYQCSIQQQTVLKNVQRVMPGEYWIIEHGEIASKNNYWQLEQVQVRDIDFDSATIEFDDLMAQVMKEHIRSDVPYGLFLSGGVDSAVLLAQLKKFTSEPIATYSVGFNDSRIENELPLAQIYADKFGTVHHEIKPSQTDIFNVAVHTIWAADDLMWDYANLPTSLLAAAAAKDLKVVFSGEGGDEAFGGYRRYYPGSVEAFIKQLIYPSTGGFRGEGQVRGGLKNLFHQDFIHQAKPAREVFEQLWKKTNHKWDQANKFQYMDIKSLLPDNLLVKADRMTMAWGLEGRVPFLDHRVVEFGLSLPPSLKYRDGAGKWFLKQWASRDLPAEMLFAPKRGFYVPMRRYFSDEFKRKLVGVLQCQDVLKAFIKVEDLPKLAAQVPANARATRLFWAILQLAIWYKIFAQQAGQQPAKNIDPLEFLSS